MTLMTLCGQVLFAGNPFRFIRLLLGLAMHVPLWTTNASYPAPLLGTLLPQVSAPESLPLLIVEHHEDSLLNMVDKFRLVHL